MSRHTLAKTVVVTDDTNQVHVLLPGTVVPKELRKFVTNARAFAETPETPLETPGGSENGAAGDGTAEKPDYGKLDYPELKALAKERELPTTGKKDEIVARLKQLDIDQAADKGTELSVDGTSTPDYSELDEDALKALLTDRELPLEGDKGELIARLTTDDADKAESGEGTAQNQE